MCAILGGLMKASGAAAASAASLCDTFVMAAG